MDRRLWLVVLCVLCLLLVANGQRSEGISGSIGPQPYQLVAAEQGQQGKIVFLVDTRTGRVWQYRAAILLSDGPPAPESFIPIGFGIPHQGVPGWGLKGSAAEASAR